jgi:hypothetical protein
VSVSEERRADRNSRNGSRHRKRILQAVVVHQPRRELDVRGQVLERRDRVPNLIDHLEIVVSNHPMFHGLQSMTTTSKATRRTGSYSPFIWYLAQGTGKPSAERGLDNRGGDRNAPDGTEGPDQIDGRCADGVV